jgi:hypothetical protein
MTQRNHFLIRNDFCRPLTLNIEPEGVLFPLHKGEEVSVTDIYTQAPVTVKLSSSDQGEPMISLWPGDGHMTVEKDGVAVFDLIPKVDALRGQQTVPQAAEA